MKENIRNSLVYIINNKRHDYEKSCEKGRQSQYHIYETALKALEELKELDNTVCAWTLEDIFEQATSLEMPINEAEAKQILKRFEHKFDASEGMTLICNLIEELRDNRNDDDE